METLLLALITTLLAIGGLAVGLLAGRGPIKGTCGSVNCKTGIACGACALRRKRGST